MSKTRAIRFSDQEEKQIEEFLEKNPFFDFSTLARVSIMSFVEEPTVAIQPVKNRKNSVKQFQKSADELA